MLFSRLYQKAVDWLSKDRPRVGMPLSDYKRLRHELRPCDVILVEGTSHIAHVIKTITQSRWSHAALYIGKLHDIEDPLIRRKVKQHFDGQPDIQLIIESELGIGTVIRPLNVYEQKHLRICRPRELHYSDMQKVINYAVKQLGVDYDVRQIMDLARFYMPYGWLPRRFQSSLFRWKPGGSTRTVCSTMIAEAFAAVQYPILPLVKKLKDGKVELYQRNPKLNVPSDFDYSPYFDIIKYPFMDFVDSKETRYKLMPWTNNDDNLEGLEVGAYVSSKEHVEQASQSRKRSISEKDNLK